MSYIPDPTTNFLEERGIEMVLSHPSKTRIIAEGKIKTDKIDSKNLAKLLRADFLPQSYIPSKEIILMTIPGIDYYSAMIIRKFYLRLKKQKGTKIAVVATARKLLRVIYCMLTRKENYREERKALTESKLRRLEKTAC